MSNCIPGGCPLRYGLVTTAIVEKLVLEMNPAQHQAFEAFVAEVAQALAHPSLDRPQQAQQQAGVSSLGELYNQAAAVKPAFSRVLDGSTVFYWFRENFEFLLSSKYSGFATLSRIQMSSVRVDISY